MPNLHETKTPPAYCGKHQAEPDLEKVFDVPRIRNMAP